MNLFECVDENELLYRHFRSNLKNRNEKHYDTDESGEIVIDRAAFSSGNPSVDIARLIICPNYTKFKSTDETIRKSGGVMGIWTKEIESIEFPDYPDYIVKVKKDPEEGKEFHAEIVLLSEKNMKVICKKPKSLSRQFRKLLAEISVCVIKPYPF